MNIQLLPPYHASQPFPESVVAFAQRQGVLSVELDQMAQAISRLNRNDSTILPGGFAEDFRLMEQLGYVQIEQTVPSQIIVHRTSSAPLLLNYFWSVWVPAYYKSRPYLLSVAKGLNDGGEENFCTAVFRVPGDRSAVQTFVLDLATKFATEDTAQVVHLQAGDHLNESSTGGGNA